MATTCRKLEFALLLTVCIYAAKVMLVFVYMDQLAPSSEVGLNGQVYKPDATFARLKLERKKRIQSNVQALRNNKKDDETVMNKTIKGAESNSQGNGIVGSARKQNIELDSPENGGDKPLTIPAVEYEYDAGKRTRINAHTTEHTRARIDKNNTGINSGLFNRVLVSKFDHSQGEKCQDVFVVAVINSNPKDLDFRMAIRETWANDADAHQLRVLTMFVLGSPNDDVVKSSVFQENERHDDILMGSMADTAGNSTLKLLLGLNWATSQCPTAKYVFIGDDHMFVIYERLVRRLRAINKGEGLKMWNGRISLGKNPERHLKSRYYVSMKQFPGSRYPNFCTVEAGYVLSMDAAKEICTLSWDEPLLPLPDIYTGVLANKANIQILEDKSFTFGDLAKDVCELSRVITTRGLKSAEHLKTIWEKLSDPEFRRNCPDPDLNLVLGSQTNNQPYLGQALQLRLDHPGICFDSSGNEESIFIIVLISTLPRHFELRRAIRETWGNDKDILGENIRLVFVMGFTQIDVQLLQEQVKREDDKYGDIIQANFMESFQNLTLKVVLGLKWVTENCRHAKYMYKGDDDMFVNLNHIVSYLKENRIKGPAMYRYYLGSVLYRSVRVTRENSKYYVPDKLYSGRYFPPYCSGGGYIISTDIIPEMYHKSLETAFIPIDDAYQGILMSKIGVKPVTHKGFKNWGAKTDVCSLRDVMVVHGFKSPTTLKAVWKNYTTPIGNCPNVS